MQFRFASTSDLPTLAQMNEQLIRDEGHRNRMTVAELETRMGEFLQSGYSAVLFESAGITIGYALFMPDREWIYLRQFFVRPEHRRKGLGREAIDWLRISAWKGQRVRVEVLVGNATGIAFWRAVGFADYCLTLESDRGNSN